MLALLDHLKADSAFIIGTSKATGGALRAAVDAPERVRGLVLIGVFVAAPRSALLTTLTTGLLLSPLWGVTLYRSYFAKMYPKARPADFEEHRKQVIAMLKEPGRLRALRKLFSESDGATYARHAQVQTSTLILMGSRDPDMQDPVQEAHTLGSRLPHAIVEIIEGAGHHLQAEVPEIIGPLILNFLQNIEASTSVEQS
jgi:pimeloyl-ACP methyl ester carboxylesterase